MAGLCRNPRRPKLVVGFAAETENVIAHAQAKLARKGCDWIVANDVSVDMMGGEINRVHIVTADGVESWDRMAKRTWRSGWRRWWCRTRQKFARQPLCIRATTTLMQDHENTPFPALPVYSEDARIARSAAFYDALTSRHSCRHFADTPVPRTVIENALLAAGTAPSGANHQPWHFAVIGSAENKRALREAAEAEERSFYADRAGSNWLDALAPLGTDANKPYSKRPPG